MAKTTEDKVKLVHRLHDYAVNEQTALVSPTRNADGLSQNLIRLLDDEILLQTLSENGCRKISELDWQDNCDRLVSLFENP